jgi:hypothetical protein
MTASQLPAEQFTTTITIAHSLRQVNNKKPIRHCRPLYDRRYRLSLVSFLLRKLAGRWLGKAPLDRRPNLEVNFFQATAPRDRMPDCLHSLYLYAVGSLHAVMRCLRWPAIGPTQLLRAWVSTWLACVLRAAGRHAVWSDARGYSSW